MVLLIKKVNKFGQLWIPVQMQKQLKIKNGDLIYVYKHEDTIVMEKVNNENQDKLLNQCVLSNGRISIPIEIRRILKIKHGITLNVEISFLKRQLILRPRYN